MTEKSIVTIPKNVLGQTSAIVPMMISRQGEKALKRFLEFFTATIRNKNTRQAYYRGISQFFDWCEKRNITDLAKIEPIVVAAYIEKITNEKSAPTVKQHLAGIRMLFDWLVNGQIVPTNPAHSVKGPKHVIEEGETPMPEPEEVRELFASFDATSIIGLRDRAIIGVMTYTFARVSAVSKLKVEDYYPQGKQWYLKLTEKGGKALKPPVNRTLENYLDEYIQAAGISEDKKGFLFRSTVGKSKTLTDRGMHRTDILRMVNRRAKNADVQTAICNHSFRARGITSYLQNGGSLETAQRMAGHASPKTTKLYDRRNKEIDVAEVERIRI